MHARTLVSPSLLLLLLACAEARDTSGDPRAGGSHGDGGSADGGASGDGGDGGWTGDGGTLADGGSSGGGTSDDGSTDGGTDGDGGAPLDTGGPGDTGEPDEDCLDHEDPALWLSPDDSNSMASPVLVREALVGSGSISTVPVRPWEFFNYASWDYPAAESGELALHAAVVPTSAPDTWRLQIGLASEHVEEASRDPMNLVFSVDTSGSMTGGPLGLVQDTLYEISSHLRAGDVVSLVTWNTDQTVVLANHAVTGSDDGTLRDAIGDLEAGGSTNLFRGLNDGYDLALESYDTRMTNRVILLSDGGANAGQTDIDLIAEHAGEEGEDGIYLVGVGVGEGFGYHDDLMDAVTDAGKGANVYISDLAEIDRVFGDRFLSTMEVAAREVEVELRLPPGFQIVAWSGEELSADRAEVEPQNIAPNDAMVFHQVIRRCAPVAPADDTPITITAHYKDAVTWEARTTHLDTTWGALVAADRAPVDKGAAILATTDAVRARRGEPIGVTYAVALANA
jgi:Ca-activated chloride channel family protein